MPPDPLAQTTQEWRSVERILAMRLDNIGDVVMMGPALRALRKSFPHSHISLLTSRVGHLVTPLLPWIDEALVHTAVWQDAFWEMPLDASREHIFEGQLREGHFDAAIIFTSFSQTPYPAAYACYLAGIPIRVGQSKEFGGSVLSHWVRSPHDGMHQAKRNMRLLEEAGIPADDSTLELVIPAAIQDEANDVLASHGVRTDESFIAVAPGASCLARTYPLERFLAVITGLASAADLPVVVLGSKRELALRESLETSSECVSLVGETTVPQFAGVLRRASLVVANDSAAMHMADAFARPMVILFSGSDREEQWAPQKSSAMLLRRATRCFPCYRFRCPTQMECLAFPPEEVVNNVLSLLATSSCYGAIRPRIPEGASQWLT